MRFMLALTAAASLAACSHNKAAQVNTPPETGRVATDTVRTTGLANDTAHAVVTEKVANPKTDTVPVAKPGSKATAENAPHLPTVTPDSAKAPPDSM
jgi:hypothetical protein